MQRKLPNQGKNAQKRTQEKPGASEPETDGVRFTPKQQRFVSEYLIDFNGSAAARRAGYSEVRAGRHAQALLGKAHIRKAISDMQDCATKSAQVTVNRTIREWGRIAYSDIRQLFDSEGKILPAEQWSADLAAAIQSIEVTCTGSGDSTLTKVRLWPKTAALEALSKHLGLLSDKQKLEVTVEKIERVVVDAVQEQPKSLPESDITPETP